MNYSVYLSPPDVGPEEQDAIARAMASGWVAPLGPEVDAFEAEIAERVGVKHAVALSSGTAALHLGLITLGVGRGDVVITSTMTFVATANAILYTGATPYFVDCDVATGNMSPELLTQAILKLKSENKKIGAIVPVDLLGKAVNYSEIQAISEHHGIPLLADSAESLGASHHGKPVGSWGAASAFSFNGNKIITTSGGGMLVTDDAHIESRARKLATQARESVPHYEHVEMGFNYRLSNILAALGRAQLSRFEGILARRRNIRENYRSYLSAVEGVSFFDAGDDAEDNCWLTSIVVDSSTSGWSADDLGEYLRGKGIEARPLWKPMHEQPLFASAESVVDGSSSFLFRNGLTLPSGSSQGPQQQDLVRENILEFISSR